MARSQKPPVRRGRAKGGSPHRVDVHVGMRLRQRRNELGLSQEALAEMIGLTFQQVQKYERGANRIGASRLWEVSEALKVEVGYFFEDREDGGGRSNSPGLAEAAAPTFNSDPLRRSDTVELVTAYHAIAKANLRRRIFEFARALAADINDGATC